MRDPTPDCRCRQYTVYLTGGPATDALFGTLGTIMYIYQFQKVWKFLNSNVNHKQKSVDFSKGSTKHRPYQLIPIIGIGIMKHI